MIATGGKPRDREESTLSISVVGYDKSTGSRDQCVRELWATNFVCLAIAVIVLVVAAHFGELIGLERGCTAGYAVGTRGCPFGAETGPSRWATGEVFGFDIVDLAIAVVVFSIAYFGRWIARDGIAIQRPIVANIGSDALT